MFDSPELREELQTLKTDLSRLLQTTSEGLRETPRQTAEALAGQVKGALSDLSELLGEQEDRLGSLLVERPIASLASACALGIAIGFMLRGPSR
jgi:ElaB/YqjD/DUF883 family membrane-anchored ribosome-binding protein